jgi:hypothetical protein
MTTNYLNPTHKPRRVLWVGKKTRAWINARGRLKRKFLAMGITRCELAYPNCTQDDFLSWAHGKKRRHLVGDELETLVVLACQNCHARIERMPEAAMCAIVESVISEREK